MSKQKLISILAVVVVAVISAVFGWIKSSVNKPEPVEGQCIVHYIDVGQGDCALIECGGEFVLIDAGENGNEEDVFAYLDTIGVEKLKYVIATHPHSDHMGGLAEVITEYEVESVIMPKLTRDQTPTTKTYKDFLEAVSASGAKGIYSKVGETYTVGDAEFTILGPTSDETDNLNDMSVVVKLVHGENSFLFTGDAEYDEEHDILDTSADLDCDVYKVGHHGSGTSSSYDLLNAVTPEICIISCGADNSYGHPHENAVERLENFTDEIYRTDLCGDIVVTSDGEKLEVTYENQ